MPLPTAPNSSSPVAPVAFAALLAFASVAIALVTQHAFGMEPCAWCIVQRVLMIIAALAAATAALLRVRRGPARAAVAVALAAAGAGLSAAAWQQGVASQSLSCARTLADRVLQGSGLPYLWPAVFEATASCADANQPLLGLPYAAWSGLVFLAIALLCALGWRRASGQRTAR